MRLLYIACNFSNIVVQLQRVLKMTSDWKTQEEMLQDRKSQQLVAQIYTVRTCYL